MIFRLSFISSRRLIARKNGLYIKHDCPEDEEVEKENIYHGSLSSTKTPHLNRGVCTGRPLRSWWAECIRIAQEEASYHLSVPNIKSIMPCRSPFIGNDGRDTHCPFPTSKISSVRTSDIVFLHFTIFSKYIRIRRH